MSFNTLMSNSTFLNCADFVTVCLQAPVASTFLQVRKKRRSSESFELCSLHVYIEHLATLLCFTFVQVCCVDVPERVCHAAGGQTWRQAVLQTVNQHAATGSCRPSHEGQHALSGVCFHDAATWRSLWMVYFQQGFSLCLSVDISLLIR